MAKNGRSHRFETASGIVYERRGTGRPIVLLHGWCLNRRLWTYTEEELAPHFEVVTPDLAGFGRSDGLAGPYALARYGDDVQALLAEAGLENAILAGFAFGAMVALEAAARRDPRIGGVVAVGLPDAASSPYQKMPRAMRRDWPDFAARSAQALFHTPPSEATRNWIAGMFASAPLPVALDVVAVLAAYDPVAAVKTVSAPLLLVNGANDPVAPVAVGEACRDAAPNARLEVIPDCGHLIVIDRKDPFHALLRGFAETA